MTMTFALMGLGGSELIMIFAAMLVLMIIVAGMVLVLFGAKRIPQFARGLGHGIKEFKKAYNDEPPK